MMHNPPHPGEILMEDVVAALGLTAQAWLTMQAKYDLWQAIQRKQPAVRPLQDASV
jgi:plasmid maintenance system antidote protein VapI